ncbi:MAG: D-alanine--D-alanine ligase [Actinomycetia bacterium]|nr:D-alanine--D-alanine ligase [Actinomycetes bacterium]
MRDRQLSDAQEKVAVLLGGSSAEREVSLATGGMVAGALRDSGFEIRLFDTQDSSFIAALMDFAPDVVFNALHGRGGEDGTMQGLLEVLGYPYTGSGVLASALAMDKSASKQIYLDAQLPTSPYLVFPAADIIADEGHGPYRARIISELGNDVVVKPNHEGSSVGVTIVHAGDGDDLSAALTRAASYGGRVLVERFIAGTEVMASVLGNADPHALPTIEVVARGNFYDYDSKYSPGGSEHIIPARVGEEANKACAQLAEQAHRALGCWGYSRSDLIVDEAGQPWLIETNTLPGMTRTSLFPDAARAVGIDFAELCVLLVHLAQDPR